MQAQSHPGALPGHLRGDPAGRARPAPLAPDRAALQAVRPGRATHAGRLRLALQPQAAAPGLLRAAHPEVHRRGRQRADHRQARHRQEPCRQGRGLPGHAAGLRRALRRGRHRVRAATRWARTAEQAALLRGYIDPDLLVLDDLFLARRISEAGAELLQTVVHQRYKLRRSIVVTSNRVVQDWGKYLGDATMATTILDRLMHRAHHARVRGQELPPQGGRQPLTGLVKQGESKNDPARPIKLQSACPAWGNLTRPKVGEFEVANGAWACTISSIPFCLDRSRQLPIE